MFNLDTNLNWHVSISTPSYVNTKERPRFLTYVLCSLAKYFFNATLQMNFIPSFSVQINSIGFVKFVKVCKLHKNCQNVRYLMVSLIFYIFSLLLELKTIWCVQIFYVPLLGTISLGLQKHSFLIWDCLRWFLISWVHVGPNYQLNILPVEFSKENLLWEFPNTNFKCALTFKG